MRHNALLGLAWGVLQLILGLWRRLLSGLASENPTAQRADTPGLQTHEHMGAASGAAGQRQLQDSAEVRDGQPIADASSVSQDSDSHKEDILAAPPYISPLTDLSARSDVPLESLHLAKALVDRVGRLLLCSDAALAGSGQAW